MKKVVKFGGSSLASAEQFKKVKSIIQGDDTRRYVIPSAPGKRYEDNGSAVSMLRNDGAGQGISVGFKKNSG